MEINRQTFLGLDVGNRRIGVALASANSRIPQPYTYIDRQVTDPLVAIEQLVASENVSSVIVGLPRSLSGDDTPQTTVVRKFAQKLTQQLGVPVIFQDEALSSQRAEDELFAKNKPFRKGDIDALAAAIILDDWLQVNVGVQHV